VRSAPGTAPGTLSKLGKCRASGKGRRSPSLSRKLLYITLMYIQYVYARTIQNSNKKKSLQIENVVPGLGFNQL
jgi:hypothetical protein